MDVATVGSLVPERAVVVTSGIHGVEGFAGSAVQTEWLRRLGQGKAAVPDRVRLVFAHALNPYGFAWIRRANECNVDLNRNFLLAGDSYSGI